MGCRRVALHDCCLCVGFIGAMLNIDLNEVHLGYYIICNVLILASVAISSVLAYIAKLRVMPYISAALGTVVAAVIACIALTLLEGFAVVVGFIIFVLYEFCICRLCFSMATLATKASNK